MDEKNKKDRMEELENVIHAIILVYENCVPMVAGFYPCEMEFAIASAYKILGLKPVGVDVEKDDEVKS